MELCLLGILLELLIPGKAHAVIPHRIIHTSGEQALLPCETVSPDTRWFWFPLNTRCANIRQDSVEITWNPTTHEVTPLRFNRRLVFQTPKSLLLRNLVMSDAGTYICFLPNYPKTHTILHVTPGCQNNLLVSSQWLSEGSVQLSCHHCHLLSKTDAFHWTLNSKPLGNRRWAEKSNFGSSVILYPIREVIWGRWECHSVANPSWVSEICLSPPRGRKEVVLQQEIASAEPTSLASSRWADPAFTRTTATVPVGRDVKGFAVWSWALLLAGLVLVLAALGMAVWRWKRQVTGRKRGGKKEWTDHASIRTKEETCQRESLNERPASLHYAQLQHPQRKSRAVQTPDSITVYAVIV